MKKISKLDSNTKEYLILYAFGLLLLLSSFFVNSPKEIFDGMNTIFFSPSNLTTDYIEIGNLGAALFNSGMMTLLSIFLARRVGAMINGPLIAGIFIVLSLIHI